MIKLVAFLSLFLASLPLLADLFTRKEFIVRHSGIVVVSGASTGIGKDAAFELGKQGFTVYAGVRSDQDITKLTAEAKSLPLTGKLLPVKFDVTREKDIDQLYAQIIPQLSAQVPFAGLINNAGIAYYYPIELFNITMARTVFEVNFWGTFALTQKFLPLLKEHQGRVLFVSSVAGLVSVEGSSVYSATKRSMEAFVDSLRLEVQDAGVSVSSILPGYIETAIGKKSDDYMSQVNPEHQKLYPSFFKPRSIPPRATVQVTTEAIVDAMLNPFPRTRYPVGPCTSVLNAGHLSILAGILPDRLADLLKK